MKRKEERSPRKGRRQHRQPPRWLVTVDPGADCGWAVFERGKLVACGYGAHDTILDNFPYRNRRKGVFLVEIPRAYPVGRSLADPNDLIRTGIRAGEFKTLFRILGMDLEEVEPKRWKGNTPKPKKASEPYLVEERVIEKLDEVELTLLYQSKSARAIRLNHNLIDAVGMGLWRLGRWI